MKKAATVLCLISLCLFDTGRAEPAETVEVQAARLDERVTSIQDQFKKINHLSEETAKAAAIAITNLEEIKREVLENKEEIHRNTKSIEVLIAEDKKKNKALGLLFAAIGTFYFRRKVLCYLRLILLHLKVISSRIGKCKEKE